MTPDRSPDLRRELRALRAYAVVTFPFACIPFLWFYYRENGIDLETYGGLVSAYYVTTVLAEVPTGILADRYGRRTAMIAGPLLFAAGFAAVLVWPSYTGFLIGQMTIGLAQSVLSGPPSALLYRVLAAHDRTHEFLAEESRIHALRLLGTGSSFLLGGVLAWLFGYEAAVLATVALCTLGGLLAFSVHEPPRLGQRARSRAVFAHAGAELLRPAVRWMLVYYVVLFVLLRFPFHTYQPYLEEWDADNPLWIGALFFVLNAVAYPASRFAPQLFRRVGSLTLLTAMPLTLAGSLLVMAGEPGWLGVAMFFAQQVPFGMHWSLLQGFVNDQIADTARATVLSAVSFVGRIVFAGLFPLVLAITDGVRSSYFLVGTVGIVATIACMLAGRRHLATAQPQRPPAAP